MEPETFRDVPRPIGGGKNKTISPRLNILRKPSWSSTGRSESSSVPSVLPIDSNTFSDDWRDDVCSFASDGQNNNKTTSDSDSRESSWPFPNDFQQTSERLSTFEFDPAWDVHTFESSEDRRVQQMIPNEFRAKHAIPEFQTRSLSKTKKAVTYKSSQVLAHARAFEASNNSIPEFQTRSSSPARNIRKQPSSVPLQNGFEAREDPEIPTTSVSKLDQTANRAPVPLSVSELKKHYELQTSAPSKVINKIKNEPSPIVPPPSAFETKKDSETIKPLTAPKANKIRNESLRVPPPNADVVETKIDTENETRFLTSTSTSTANKIISESLERSRPTPPKRQRSLKLDQWSSVLVRKKDPYKYKSFLNEKMRDSRSKGLSKVRPPKPALFKKRISLEHRDELQEMENLWFNQPSFQIGELLPLTPLNDRPVTNDNVFHPNVRDESHGREKSTIGPLGPNTTLRMTAPEEPRELSHIMPDSIKKGNHQQLPELLPLESKPIEKRKCSPSSIVEQDSIVDDINVKKSNTKGILKGKLNGAKSLQKDKPDIIILDDGYDCLSQGDFSSIFSEKSENLPLLKAWGTKMVDCNHCGSSKPRKKDARKKKAEARKKYVEALWERKQFYWKYEAVGSAKTKAKKKYLDEQDTLVSKIVPETEEAATPAVNEPLTPDEDFIDIPLGFQLSTITEGDEDVTARSMNRTISLGAGILQQDGKVKLNPQVVGSLLDNNNKNAAVSRSEDEIENVTKVDSVRPVAPVTNPGPKPSTKPQKQRKSRRSAHRRGVLTVNEISVPTADSDESVDSKGEISDITEDYLHIPFSSPLYSKVIQAFREASKFTDTKDADDSARKKYLQSVKF